MNDLLGLIRDYASPVNTLVLLAGLWFIRRIDRGLEDVRTNHIPHLDARLARLEGRFDERDAALKA